MEIVVAVALALSIFDIARMIVLFRRIRQPIRRYLRKWRRYNKRASSPIANPNLSMYRYAYSQLSAAQLKHVKLAVESEKSTGFVMLVIDLALRVLLPVVAFLFGVMTALTNRTSDIAPTQQDATILTMIETLKQMNAETLGLLMVPTALVLGAILLVTVTHFLYVNVRNNAVAKLSGLLDQLINDPNFDSNPFKIGTQLRDEEQFRHAAFFQIPVSVTSENETKPVSRGVIRKTSFVSATIDRQSFEKNTYVFTVF